MAVVFEEVMEGGGEELSSLLPLPLFELVREREGRREGGRGGGRKIWRDRGWRKGEDDWRKGKGNTKEWRDMNPYEKMYKIL